MLVCFNLELTTRDNIKFETSLRVTPWMWPKI